MKCPINKFIFEFKSCYKFGESTDPEWKDIGQDLFMEQLYYHYNILTPYVKQMIYGLVIYHAEGAYRITEDKTCGSR